MSIWGINDSSSLTDLYQTYLSQSSGATSTDDESTSNALSDDASKTQGTVDSIVFSPKGQIYSRLKQLQASDPEQFKKVCSEIADGLRNTGNTGSGGAALAAKFEKAAETGDMSSLTSSDATGSYSTARSMSSYLSQFGTSQASDDDTALLQAILGQAGISI